MKLRVVLLPILMGLFVCTSALAQIGDAVKTEIPFDFYVGTHKMTAGTYFVSLNQGTHRVEISGVDKNDRATVMGTPTGTADKTESPSLEFDRIGNDHFLKSIKTSDQSLAFDVNKIEQQITGTTASETVVTRLSR